MSEYRPEMTPPPVAATQTSTMAIISLVLGILGWVILPVLGAIGAVITGHLAKSEISKSMGRLTGNGMATVGLVLGYVQIALAVCGLGGICVLSLLGPSIGNVFSNIIVNLVTPTP